VGLPSQGGWNPKEALRASIRVRASNKVNTVCDINVVTTPEILEDKQCQIFYVGSNRKFDKDFM
jgi:hypothetical protein